MPNCGLCGVYAVWSEMTEVSVSWRETWTKILPSDIDCGVSNYLGDQSGIPNSDRKRQTEAVASEAGRVVLETEEITYRT